MHAPHRRESYVRHTRAYLRKEVTEAREHGFSGRLISLSSTPQKTLSEGAATVQRLQHLQGVT